MSRRTLWGAVISLIIFGQGCTQQEFSRKPPPSCNGFNQQCTVGPNGTNLFDYIVSTEQALPKKQVDLLFVVDNSESMRVEQSKMADRFVAFVNSLTGIDWQIGITTTDIVRGGGRFLPLGTTSRTLLKSTDNDADTLFRQTIQRPEVGIGDERGIYAANLNLENYGSQFVRSQSQLSIIVLSDEDERSTGGADRPLEANDLPQTLVSKVKEKFGPDRTFLFHSIVIKPGDQTCLQAQSTQAMKGFEGKTYSQLTQMTSGILGDICAVDYGSQLASIGQTIQALMSSMKLACEPQKGKIDVELSPAAPGMTFSLAGSQLVFAHPLPPGTQIRVKYECPRE